ncbi:hypothetical protein B0T10DRAFT_489896 [Thelonectria olida]|uniref:Uncharacterized protein n=1 Tax=Thelonectria olida TaxID=1576542 RepID=A0A9P9ARB2_9HYPO|nr:hypothetical protein B0T10DRAFT_489896 [Thelonectria olida]
MSSTTSVASAPTNGCSANLYDTPSGDHACALPYSKNATDILIACCGKADVVSYYNECGVYCLAIDQTVADLISCFKDEGASDASIFCRGNGTDTASKTQGSIAKTASASIIHTAGSTITSSSDSDDKSDDDDSDSTSTASGSSSSSTNSDNAAPGVHPQGVVSTLGLTIVGLLFSATLFGAVQI